MPFQRLKGVHALAKDFSPAYQQGVRNLRSIQDSTRAAREYGAQVGGGASVGALSGGISNYLAEGDMDHALRGALTGGIIGGVGGRLTRNANPLTRLAVTGGVPAVLAQIKDRPGVSRLFRPEHTDSISSLYSEQRAFEEESPEWQEYYAANPDRYDARYNQQKSANWKTQALVGTGLLGAGTLGGALLAGESKEDFANRLDAEDAMIDSIDMGMASEEDLANFLISKRDAGELAMPEDRYFITTSLDKVKEASMSLNDIATMEAMSGVNVGRTRTKVGMIIDSNGVYTLYDESGKYTYGEFTKLSEAQDLAEKVAQYYTQWNELNNSYDTMRKGRMPWSKGTVVKPGDLGRGWSQGGKAKDFAKMTAAQDVTKGYNASHQAATTQAGYGRGYASGKDVGSQQQAFKNTTATQNALKTEQQLAQSNRRAQHIADQAKNWKTQAQTHQQTIHQNQQAHQNAMKQQQAAAQRTQQQAAAQAEQQLAAQTKKTTDATKSLAKWKKGTGIAGLTLGLGAAAYGAYNYFNKPKSWTDRATGALNDAVGTMSDYQKYLPMANQFANTAMNVGGAANTAFNPYTARGGQYQQMPTYGRGYNRGYNRGY